MTVRLSPWESPWDESLMRYHPVRGPPWGHRMRNNCSSLVPQKQCTPLAFIISIPPPLGDATISFLYPSGIVPLVLRERRPVRLTKTGTTYWMLPLRGGRINRPHAISTTRVVDSKATSRNSRNKNTIINMVFGSDRPGTYHPLSGMNPEKKPSIRGLL
jgi:hypothetical protein